MIKNFIIFLLTKKPKITNNFLKKNVNLLKIEKKNDSLISYSKKNFEKINKLKYPGNKKSYLNKLVENKNLILRNNILMYNKKREEFHRKYKLINYQLI